MPGTARRTATASDDRSRLSTPHFTQYPLRTRILLSQLPLTLSALLVTFVVLLFETRIATDSPHLLGGLAAILALTVAAGAVPWQKFPPVVYWVIPLLDFVAIAPFWSAARFAVDGMSALTAFPVFWLAWSGLYPALGITLGFLGSAVVAWWPYVAGPDLLGDVLVEPDLTRPALIPFLTLALGVAASVLTRSMDRQSHELAASLENAATQNRMLTTVVDTSEVGILVVDRDGHDVLMNPAQRRMHFFALPTGSSDATEAELLVFEVDGTTPIAVPDRPVARAVQGESFQGRLITLGTGGNQQHLSVSAAPMLNDDGALDGTVVIFQNVTDLLGAIRAREQFIAEVTHEFRTPLTSIIGYLDLALESDPDPRLERYLSTSNRNAERLLTLVTNLLDASGSTIAVQDVDLAQLVRYSLDSVEVRAQRAEVALESELPNHLEVVADAVKMGQVVDNLLSNAIKYTPAGGSIAVSLREVSAADGAAHGPGSCAELVIRDTGIGLSEQEQRELFTHFYRADHVRKAAIPGTGLGLAISRGFVRAHGGEIQVSSRKDVGSTFTVRIPMAGPPSHPDA